MLVKATILSVPSMQVLQLHASLQAAQTPSSKDSHAAIFCLSPTTVASSLQHSSDLYTQRRPWAAEAQVMTPNSVGSSFSFYTQCNTDRLHNSAIKPHFTASRPIVGDNRSGLHSDVSVSATNSAT